MSQAIELQLTCPQCGTEFTHTGHTVVDMGNEADSEVLWQLQNGTLNRAECPNCHTSGLIPIPVALNVPEQQLLLVFAPGASQLDEEQLGGVIGPVLESFINSLPEEKQADEYLLSPIVTDEVTALQQAARGELTSSDLMSKTEYLESDDEDEDDAEGDEPPLTLEEQQAIQARMQFLQTLFQATDSLQRISMMRGQATLVDDLFLEVIGMISEQAERAQPEVVPVLSKIMNEAEVFIASNQPN